MFNWKEEDTDIDSIVNPKVCLLEGDSLNFVKNPLAYLITSKLRVDITKDNESFSVTCCFHFDD
jgi:hypothetical protein